MNTSSVAIAILIIGFLVLIILRFPVAYAVALASMACLVYQGKSLNALCQQMVKGISSFSLMAVPFFITMGILMGSGGISEKLIALANACVGWMRGGMAMVNIVASYFFGGISGSASADTASLGSILIPMMVDQGYDGDFSTAVTITSSCEGLLVPPSHNMVIYAIMVGSYIISVKRQYPKGEPFSISKLLKQLATSIWALAAILIVVVGVVAGVFTATESAAIAVIYSLLVSVFIYKGLTWKGVWKALDGCIDTLSIVLILISTSSIFGYCLTQLHVPDLASSAILGLTDNKIIIFLLVDLIILLLGCIMDMSPIILITTPILLPIVSGLGMDPIQFGIIMVLISRLLTYARRNRFYTIVPGTLTIGEQTASLAAVVVTRGCVLGVNCYGFGGSIEGKSGSADWVQTLNGERKSFPSPTVKNEEQRKILADVLVDAGYPEVDAQVVWIRQRSEKSWKPM